jgi:lipopolysaccharide transport system ATP-binding protein
MSDTVISVENLGKSYLVGHQAVRETHVTLRDVIGRGAHNFARKTVDLLRGRQIVQGDEVEEFWALKNISFEVKQGEVVGIIGRNGCGKSTLLKILSRITDPTEGRVRIRGRVASLLEVGTGFHPELTGRENIYLNGAILGMTRDEIRRKFDDIVSFSEVEKFLDTPVKRYSSGMYVRLAFAVAAHLEPEILVVDEVLAVGDAEFQKKCLTKMEGVAKQGRTVLFVSHNMGAILNIVTAAMLMHDGRAGPLGSPEGCVSQYLASGYSPARTWLANGKNDHPMQLLQCKVLGKDGATDGYLDVRNSVVVQIRYEVRQPVRGATIAANLHAADGAHIMSLEDIDGNPTIFANRDPGIYVCQVTLPGLLLNRGRYFLRIGCGIAGGGSFENIDALAFDIVETADHFTRNHRGGYFVPMYVWKTDLVSNLAVGST